MELAAEGNAAGGVWTELDHAPKRWPPFVELDAEQARLAGLLPGAGVVYYARQVDGVTVRWTAQFEAASPEELLEKIRAVRRDAGS